MSRSKPFQLIALTTLIGCSGGEKISGPGPSEPVATVEVQVPRTAIRIGETITAVAILKSGNGQVLTGKTVGWSSSDTTIVSVSQGGSVVAVRAGSAIITASSEGKSSDVTISSTPAPVGSIDITPSSTALDVGQTAQFSAIVKDSSGRTVTRVLTWESSDVTKASVSNSGFVTTLAAGAVDIRASTESKSGSARLQINARVPTSFVSSGGNQSGPAYSTLPVPLTVTARDASGNGVPGFPVTFAVFTGGGSFGGQVRVTVATNAQGIASPGNWTLGGGGGLQIVHATANGMPTIEFLALAGASLISIVSGENQTGRILSDLGSPLVVRLTDNLGNPRGGVTVTWTQVTSGGTASVASSITAANGQATLPTWTLGDTPGLQTLTAVWAGDLGPPSQITFHATASGTPVYFKATSVATAANFACSIGQDGGLYCWGGQYPAVPTLVPGAPAFVKLFGDAGTFMCGTTANNDAYCWGGTYVGDGTTSLRSSPTLVSGGHSFSKISIGLEGACGITTVGDPYCWGSGRDVAPSSTTPGLVSGGYVFTDISRGAAGACGIDGTGRVFCWGTGTILDGGGSSSVPVSTANGFNRVAVGSERACALYRTDNMTYCWGLASHVSILGSVPLVSLTAGGVNFCGLGAGGIAYCWDRNQSGATGTGGFATQLTPMAVLSDLRFSSIDSGTGYSCAVTTSSTVACWGTNSSGQLGGPSPRGALSPRRVVTRVDP